MIYDCFSFCGEFEVLDFRIHELDSVVDRFVLVESNTTHTGNPKPLFFEDNKKRYAKYLHKIEHVKVFDLPVMHTDELKDNVTLWTAEHFQRRAILRGLTCALPNDVILISDLDEIPSKDSVIKAAQAISLAPECTVIFQHLLFYYYFNLQYDVYTTWWGTGACSFGNLKDPQEIRSIARRFSEPKSGKLVALENAGWHFSYMGGAAAIYNKIKFIAEAHFVKQDIGEKTLETAANDIKNLKDPWRPGNLLVNNEVLNTDSGKYVHRKFPQLFYDTRPTVEVVAMVYKSVEYVDLIYNELVNEYTNDSNYNVSVRIIGNDPTPEVEARLKELDIPTEIYHDHSPGAYYLERVYRCWNYAVESSKSEYVVLVNSDMVFSPNWLSNLLKHRSDNKVLTSRLVESGKLLSGIHAISKNFGRSPNQIDRNAWYAYVPTISEDKIVPGGLYMPVLFNREQFIRAGKYPEGNIYPGPGQVIPGDEYFFDKLKDLGIKHFTIFDSFSYHVQEGELSS